MTELRRTILVVPPDQAEAMNAAVALATGNPADERTFSVPVYEDPTLTDEDGNNTSTLIGYVASWDFEGTGFDPASVLAEAPAVEKLEPWRAGITVAASAAVWHQGRVYEALARHTTEPTKEPPVAPELFRTRGQQV